MARYWIRAWPISNVSPYQGLYKLLTIWLINVLGYTKTDEYITSGSWTSTESSGTGGSFTGSSDVLTISGGSFTSSDAGKNIMLYDTSEPRNTGWYQICAVLSSTTLKLSWYADQYPFSSSGISWWLLGPTYEMPQTGGNWVRLESPAGWGIQFYFAASGAGIAATSDGSWDSDTIIVNNIYMRYSACLAGRLYATGNTDGSDLKIWWRSWGPSLSYPNDHPYPAGCMIMVTEIDPIESGRDDPLIAVVGPVWSDNAYQDHISRNTISRCLRTFYLDPLKGGRSMYGHMMEQTVLGWYHSFVSGLTSGTILTTPFWGHNNRLGGKIEMYYGSPIVSEDYNNLSLDYCIVGMLGGHWTCRGGVPVGQILSSDGTKKDLIHVGDGIVVEWPDGISNPDVYNPYVNRS